jgi:hypothetical protein
MMATATSRKSFTRVLAYKDAAPKPLRPARNSSSSNFRRNKGSSQQQLVAFVQVCSPEIDELISLLVGTALIQGVFL